MKICANANLGQNTRSILSSKHFFTPCDTTFINMQIWKVLNGWHSSVNCWLSFPRAVFLSHYERVKKNRVNPDWHCYYDMKLKEIVHNYTISPLTRDIITTITCIIPYTKIQLHRPPDWMHHTATERTAVDWRGCQKCPGHLFPWKPITSPICLYYYVNKG